MDLKLIGLNIKSCRNMMKLTQAQLAEAVNLSTNHISHIENGSSQMSINTLIDICKVLNTSPNQILWGTYNNTDNENSLIRESSSYGVPSESSLSNVNFDVNDMLSYNAQRMSEQNKRILLEISNILVQDY